MNYYINNCHAINMIVAQMNGHAVPSYSNTPTTIQDVITYIERHPEKAIRIGNRTNATSCMITEEQYKILAEKFPHLLNNVPVKEQEKKSGMKELVTAAKELIESINSNQAQLYHSDLSCTVDCIILEKGKVHNSEMEDDFEEYDGIEDKVKALENILEELKS